MRVIKALVYIATSSVATIAYREGNGALMGAMVMICTVLAAYDLAMWMGDSDYPIIHDIMNDFFADGTKKGTSRH